MPTPRPALIASARRSTFATVTNRIERFSSARCWTARPLTRNAAAETMVTASRRGSLKKTTSTGAAAAAAVARRTPTATLTQNSVEVCSCVRACRCTEATPSPASANRPRSPVMAKTIPCRPKSSGDKRRARTTAVPVWSTSVSPWPNTATPPPRTDLCFSSAVVAVPNGPSTALSLLLEMTVSIRASGFDEGRVELGIKPTLQLERVLFDRNAPGVGAHLRASCRVAEYIRDRGAEGFDIGHRDREAIHAVSDHVGDTADRMTDDGDPARDRLEHGIGEVVLERAHDEQIRGAVHHRQEAIVVDRSDVHPRHVDLDGGSIPADRQQHEIRDSAGALGQRFDQARKSLPLVTDFLRREEQHRRVPRDAQQVPHAPSMPRRELVDVQAVGNDLDGKSREDRAPLHLGAEPPARRDEVQPCGWHLREEPPLPFPDLVREVLGVFAPELGAPAAAPEVPVAPQVVVTAPGQGVEVVQGPDDRRRARYAREERPIVDEARDPVQIDDLARGELIEHGRPVHAAIVAEQLVAFRSRPAIAIGVPGDPHLPQASTDQLETIHGLLEHHDAGIVAGSGLHDHHGVLTDEPQALMQPIRGPCGAPRPIVLAQLNDLHVRTRGRRIG